MKPKTQGKAFLGASLLAAIAGSLCCVGPLLVLVSGTGATLSSIPWLSNARPYLISISIVSLALAFWQVYKKPKAIQDDCGCEVETKKSFLGSKTFLWIVTLLSVLFFSLPYVLAQIQPGHEATLNFPEANSRLELSINGMTCESCELHITQATQNIDGVYGTNSSFTEGSSQIWYDSTRVESNFLIETIEEKTGYQITNYNRYGN